MIGLRVLGWKRSTRDILVEATPRLEVMFPISKRHEISSRRLIIYAKSCDERRMIREIRHPHQVQDLKMVAIDLGLGLPLVNLLAWIRWRGIVSGMERTHSLRAWEMMQ